MVRQKAGGGGSISSARQVCAGKNRANGGVANVVAVVAYVLNRCETRQRRHTENIRTIRTIRAAKRVRVQMATTVRSVKVAWGCVELCEPSAKTGGIAEQQCVIAPLGNRSAGRRCGGKWAGEMRIQVVKAQTRPIANKAMCRQGMWCV